jgi:2-octaprenyl-6-methoxyphenol hydroxylase
MADKHDVIIIGAALNGLAMALALGGSALRRRLSVALVDARDPRDALQRASDGRASAITLSSRRMFEALGVWQAMQPFAQPVHQIIVTDAKGAASDRPVLLQFAAETAAGESSMLMFDNRDLLGSLVTSLQSSPDITLYSGSAVKEVDNKTPGLARAKLADGRELKAPLIIAAGGARSPTRIAAGIEMVGWTYGQSGIVTSFRHSLPHQGRAEEHFGAEGPFALLPLTDNRSSIVWTCRQETADRLLGKSPDEFERELQAQIGSHLGEIKLLAPPQGYPLGMWIAKEFHGPRLALVGDAAHVVHPLAGLGFNLGLKDAAALAECIADAFSLGQDIGSDQVLSRYAAWRRFDTVTTAMAMDGFNRLFSNEVALLKLVRDAGLKLTQTSAAAKSFFVREAAGMTGELPKLLRGERL